MTIHHHPNDIAQNHPEWHAANRQAPPRQLRGRSRNWVALQEDYNNYHLIADYHVLTTDLDASHITRDSIDMVIDWLAAGIDPKKSPMFRQSQVKQHTELHLILSMLITTARLERNPAVKEQVRDLNIENMSYGHLGYPVLQAADILLYRADLVPVGEDQVPHVEISREIARRFNNQYEPVFPEPEPKLTRFGRLPGLDGIDRKMSKSAETPFFCQTHRRTFRRNSGRRLPIRRRSERTIRVAPRSASCTCTIKSSTVQKRKRSGPGVVRAPSAVSNARGASRSVCAATLTPFRETRAYYDAHPQEIIDVLTDGEQRARTHAEETMALVRTAMHLG